MVVRQRMAGERGSGRTEVEGRDGSEQRAGVAEDETFSGSRGEFELRRLPDCGHLMDDFRARVGAEF